MRDVNVTSLFVVVATVVVATSNSGPLLCIGSHKVDVLVRVDLRLLQGGQLRSVQPQSLVRGERTTHLPAVAADSLRAGGFSGTLAGFSAVIDTQFIKKLILFFPPQHFIIVVVTSPINTVFLGQAGNQGRFTGRLTGGPTVVCGGCGYSVDLAVVGRVFVQVLDLQLSTSHRYLIPQNRFVTDHL